MPVGRHPTSDAGGRTVYTGEESHTWTIRQMRCEFDRMPAKVQEETRERVRELLLKEARRKQAQKSVLMRLAPYVYGVTE